MDQTEVLDRDVYETPQGKIFMTDDGKLRELAEQVQKNSPGLFSHCDVGQIEFALVEGQKSDWLAKAIKLTPIQRLYMPGKKFLILFNTTMIEHTTSAKTDILMFHEMLHCNTTYDSLVDHDTKDFSAVLSRFGTDWQSNDKSILSKDNLRKLTPWAISGSPQTASGKDRSVS